MIFWIDTVPSRFIIEISIGVGKFNASERIMDFETALCLQIFHFLGCLASFSSSSVRRVSCVAVFLQAVTQVMFGCEGLRYCFETVISKKVCNGSCGRMVLKPRQSGQSDGLTLAFS